MYIGLFQSNGHLKHFTVLATLTYSHTHTPMAEASAFRGSVSWHFQHAAQVSPAFGRLRTSNLLFIRRLSLPLSYNHPHLIQISWKTNLKLTLPAEGRNAQGSVISHSISLTERGSWFLILVNWADSSHKTKICLGQSMEGFNHILHQLPDPTHLTRSWLSQIVFIVWSWTVWEKCWICSWTFVPTPESLHYSAEEVLLLKLETVLISTPPIHCVYS